MNNGSTTTAVNMPEVELPRLHPAHRRLLYLHQNVPGVMSKMHNLLSDMGINVVSQYLQTNSKLGYVILDVEPYHAKRLEDSLRRIKETIWLRVLH
jgi:D-3-phosphoglycerate dehydrogenase